MVNRKTGSLGVDWHKPFVLHKKEKIYCYTDCFGNKYGFRFGKRLATSTQATSNLIALLKPKFSSFQELKNSIHFDKEAIKIIEIYENLDINYEDWIVE